MDDFLTKPVDIQLLYATLRLHLQRSAARRQGVAASSYDWITPHTAVQGLCLDEGLAHAGGDIVLYRNRLQQFFTTQRSRALEIQQVLLAGKVQEGRGLLQSLSDQAGVVGARVVETLAESLDQALQAECPQEFLSTLNALLEAALQQLESGLSNGPPEQGVAEDCPVNTRVAS